MPQYCKLCSLPDQDKVRAAFASDASDRKLARQFKVAHTTASRHRREHVVRPMRAAVAALDRGRTAHKEHEQQLAAVERGDPVAVVAAALDFVAQAAKLQRIEERLERMATQSEAGGSAQGVAQLSAQQLRSVEVGSKLAATGGYAHDKDAGQTAQKEKFSVTIHLGNGRDVSINTTHDNDAPATIIDGPVPDNGAVIDADREDDDQSDDG